MASVSALEVGLARAGEPMRPGQVLFTYLHLAADRPLTEALLRAGTTSIAYETVQQPDGSLPLLSPMSEVAGCLAPQVGAAHLMKAAGGRGVRARLARASPFRHRACGHPPLPEAACRAAS